jgi:hypothetical protein
MIVRNEEKQLPRCLESVRGLVDDLVVVDTGSTDATMDVAARFGARVLRHEWNAHFSEARNVGFDSARGAWIIVLDADESLPPASVDAVRELIARAPVEAFSLVQRSPDPGGGDLCSPTVRLVPNRPDIRYASPVHEELLSSLEAAGIPVRETSVAIDHAGYQTREIVAEKVARNGRIIEAFAARDRDPQTRYHLGSLLADRHEWGPAVEVFLESAASAAAQARPQLAAAARLRAAECLVQSGAHDRALPLLPASPDPAGHPLALLLRGHIDQKAGRPDDARRWHEAVLGAEDRAYTPPVALAALKFQSAMFLGNLWGARGRQDIGAQVLRIALELHQRQVADAGPSLLDRYTSILEAGA